MSEQVTRRTFLETSGKTAAGMAALSASLGGCAANGPKISVAAASQRRKIGANEKFNIALIGCGGMGRYNLQDFMKSGQVNVVAVCDVDDQRMKDAAWKVQEIQGEAAAKKVKQVKDYRWVIDNKDIDCVIVATPDHWHAIPMMNAVAAGKDVYCEKPCCHNIKEGRAMVEAAKKYNAIVQVGTQQRSAAHMQAARDFVRSGKLGTISMTESYTYGNEAPDGMGHDPDAPVPAGVDYETWLGPAPKRPFNKRRFHLTWRWYFEYAAGMVGDWNVHLQDIIMWTMKTPYPKAVSTSGGKLILTDDRTTPDTMLATYEFGSGPYTPNGHVHIYTMRKASGPPWNRKGYGMVFHGTNGKLHLTRDGWEVIGDAKDWSKPEAGLRVPTAQYEGHREHDTHIKNFLDCVRTRKAPIAAIDEHFKSVAACHLANVSLRAGRKLFWDHRKELCYKNAELTIPDPKANDLLTRKYRKGYELPNL